MSEEWRDIPGMEGFYQASSEGRIRSVERVHMQRMRDGSVQGVKYGGKVRATHRSANNGYLMIALSQPGQKRRTYCVHFLVCSAFHGPRPEGHEVAHGDGDRLNPKKSNLRWATRVENASDRTSHGTATIGERHGNCRLSDNDVREIRHLRSTGLRFKQIASRFGVSWETCRKINSGQKRRHVTMEAVRG
jgi:HNH endonuclease/NUMOD4 motif